MMETKTIGKVRIFAILLISILVILTGTLFSLKSFMNKDVIGGVLGIIIAITILAFAIFVYIRGNMDIKNGFPLKDERSKKIIEKASSMAFYVSLYLLLAVGFLSDDIINFRDVSQATSITVGGMAIIFLIFWIHYNKREI